MTLGKVCSTIWKKTNNAAVPKTRLLRHGDQSNWGVTPGVPFTSLVTSPP